MRLCLVRVREKGELGFEEHSDRVLSDFQLYRSMLHWLTFTYYRRDIVEKLGM